jgi:hypothetical protein
LILCPASLTANNNHTSGVRTAISKPNIAYLSVS